jgi:NAD+-dependent secondary alcohol dehydrogenase Adh1
MTMKAAQLYQYDPAMNVELVVENIPEPNINSPEDVVVRVGAAGLCRTDLHIIEGVWRSVMDPEHTLLPYVMGHENAGWVEAVGSGVRFVKRGDAVICHPIRSCGVCFGCRRGEDMYCENGQLPGFAINGGFAEYLLTNERALIKLNEDVLPLDVAPMADAGITAYRVAKRAAMQLSPGSYCVVLGVGGLGHIAIQCLREICSARIVAVDTNLAARDLAKELGAYRTLDSGPNVIDEIKEITGGGAHVVIDFVAELGAEQICWQMLRQGGTHFIVGYGGRIEIPTVHMIMNEINIAGSLAGNYLELVELMELNAQGRVTMSFTKYSLDGINAALNDFKNRDFVGRAVIVP